MKVSAKGGNQKENSDEGNIDECPQQKEEQAGASLRRTTRKRTAPKPFGNTVPSNDIPQGKRVGAKAKRAKVEKAKNEPKSKKEPKAKKDAKTKPTKEPKAKKESKPPKKTPKEKSAPKTQVCKNTEPVEQKTLQPKTTAVLGDASNGSRTNPSPKISEKAKSSDSLPEENAVGDGFVPTPPEVDQSDSPINARPDSNKENQPEDYDDFEEFMDQVKTEPVDDYEYQITMDATQTQVNVMIANIATAALQGFGNRRGTRQRTAKNQSEDSDPEFTEKQLLKRKNPVRKARGTGKKALTKRAPKGSKAALKKEALGKCEIQPFVSKLFEVLNDESFDSINWNSKGDHFIIEREAFDHQFLKLSKEEKAPIQTKEFPSFIRQLNLYGFRKRREETGSDPNHFSHYVHKDGFFMKNRPDLLVHILRSGSSREKEKQLEVGEARNKLIQERGILEGMEPAHPLPDHMDMPPCEEFILPPGSYSQPQVQPINFATNSQPTVTLQKNQDHAPTPEERMRALQNNGYYQKSGSGQWLKLPDYDRVQQQSSMMRTGDWINTQPGTSAEQNGFQSPPPIQYDITNMSPTYTGQLNVPMPSMSPMPLPAGLRSPTNNQGTNFSTYGTNQIPQSKTPAPIQGLSDIQAWLDEIPDKNPDNGATSFSNNRQKLNSVNSQNEQLNF
ncbi:Oidioi.mRNA.OKI2018_I69.PAR.g10156.t1.cds [Oikopleura dioica]|uniref:Oidioi.mRNA.OKI2018_I69.PAR.g10156.t1.cds n=1 Tax=Oikopleura dioica TaxID=34765 RepID=A0ABN7RP54_OIKDI|nr:Oidioi.mRNA.OKI2018_I69.PAR.g10156.t1.cds [Oikopleura dioica]